MEEVVLGLLLVGKELDIVDDQHIDRSIVVDELLRLVVLDGIDELQCKALGACIDHRAVGTLLVDLVTYRLHKMCLAETDSSIDHKRIEPGSAGIVGNRLRSGVRELVAVAGDEVLEVESRVQSWLHRLTVMR